MIDLNPKSFVEMIAPARTFGFKDQFQELSELGLIKGGSLENALVCDGDKWVNPPLRFDNAVSYTHLTLPTTPYV